MDKAQIQKKIEAMIKENQQINQRLGQLNEERNQLTVKALENNGAIRQLMEINEADKPFIQPHIQKKKKKK